MADPQTRQVVVATEAHIAALQAGDGLQTPVAKGTVQKSLLISQSQIAAGHGPRMTSAGGKVVRAFIEHATAEVGDVLSDAELTPALATAAQKLADMHERRKVAQAAQSAEAAASPPLTADERKAIREMLKAPKPA